MNNQKIGNFIRSLRKEKNLTQKELAMNLNITDRAISRWERGIGCPDISLLEDLSKILDVTILELLKGEHLEKENQTTNQNLMESLYLGKEHTMILIKKIINYLTIFLITTLSLFILVTNLRSIFLETKQHNYTNYLKERENQITIPPTVPIEQLVEQLNIKIAKILSNQGIYNNNDYTTIQTHINLLKDELDTQNSQKYLSKSTYTFKELVTFYLDHQNLLTPLLDRKDLYSIIISYDPSLSDHLITYYNKEQSTIENYFYIYSFLEQPYYLKNILPYQGYTPNPYLVIEYIYEKELQLANDIIKAGDIK